MKKKTLIGISVTALGSLGIICVAAYIYQKSFAEFEVHENESLKPAAGGIGGEPIYGVETLGIKATPTVLTDALTHAGAPAEVACATCHSTRTPVVATRTSDDLDEFHQGLIMEHGNLSCLSCHNPANYDTLKLADGTTVGFENVMQLCAQCHGPQTRDYRRGSHGGMNGYWDLSRGPRQRNACTVCHDVHAPAYPQLMPVFPPKDIIPPKKLPGA